jgi:3-hydroxyisobutyrate dehydrogenase
MFRHGHRHETHDGQPTRRPRRPAGVSIVRVVQVTVLGLGNMGRAFAARALQAGHSVTVWNRSAGRAVSLVERGATEAASPAEAVARADVVLVVLADDWAVLEVCLGEGGALGAMAPGSLLANISTVAPDTVRRLAEAGPDERVLDCPVMGSPAAIEAGLGRFLVGGSEVAVHQLTALLEDLGAGSTHCGPLGSGAAAKLVANLLLMTGVAAMAEGIAIARGQGFDDELLRALLGESPVLSFTSQLRLESVLDPAHPGWFSPELARKDVRLALDLAEQAGIPVRVGPATEALLSAVVETGRPWPDFAAVIEALEPSDTAGREVADGL